MMSKILIVCLAAWLIAVGSVIWFTFVRNEPDLPSISSTGSRCRRTVIKWPFNTSAAGESMIFSAPPPPPRCCLYAKCSYMVDTATRNIDNTSDAARPSETLWWRRNNRIGPTSKTFNANALKSSGMTSIQHAERQLIVFLGKSKFNVAAVLSSSPISFSFFALTISLRYNQVFF